MKTKSEIFEYLLNNTTPENALLLVYINFFPTASDANDFYANQPDIIKKSYNTDENDPIFEIYYNPSIDYFYKPKQIVKLKRLMNEFVESYSQILEKKGCVITPVIGLEAFYFKDKCFYQLRNGRGTEALEDGDYLNAIKKFMDSYKEDVTESFQHYLMLKEHNAISKSPQPVILEYKRNFKHAWILNNSAIAPHIKQFDKSQYQTVIEKLNELPLHIKAANALFFTDGFSIQQIEIRPSGDF